MQAASRGQTHFAVPIPQQSACFLPLLPYLGKQLPRNHRLRCGPVYNFPVPAQNAWRIRLRVCASPAGQKTPSLRRLRGHCHSNAGLVRTDRIAFAYGQALISSPPLSTHRYPASRLALFCFALRYRDVEDMLAERGIDVSYETVRRWALKFGTIIARKLRRGRPRPDGRWHLDEVFVSVNGKQLYVWRAVDSEGEVLDILVQPRRDRPAALSSCGNF